MKRTDTERVNVPQSLRFADRSRAVEEEGNDEDILHRAAFLGYPSPGQESEESSSSIKCKFTNGK